MMSTLTQARFDTRLPKKQKELFEYAASLGGFRNLTDFIVFCAQQEANKIIEKHEKNIVSEADKKIFFKAIMQPPNANAKLKKAAVKYGQKLAK